MLREDTATKDDVRELQCEMRDLKDDLREIKSYISDIKSNRESKEVTFFVCLMMTAVAFLVWLMFH